MLMSALFLPLLFSLGFCEEVFKFAAVIFRHGDRTPVQPYPTDPWRNESLWPVKFGELTNTGKRQHYALGQWLRSRYSGFISDQYDPDEVYVRSTDVDRTLMSAQANLAGFYPPVNNSVWDSDLLWQPIPVHTVPKKHDEVLYMGKRCDAYTIEKERYVHSKAYKDRLNQYQSLMDYLSSYTGQKVKDYMDIDYLYSTLYIESLYNFTLPNWTHTYFPDQMYEPAGYSFTIPTATPLLARLKVGPLMKQIATYMRKALSPNKNEKAFKLAIYSGHDDTVAAVLNSLGVFDQHCPPYTSTVFIELLQDNTTQANYVRVSYRNSTEIVEPRILKVPYCDKMCPLERFVKLYEKLINVDWEAECQNGVQYMQYVYIALISLAIGILILIMAHKAYSYSLHFNYYRTNIIYSENQHRRLC